MSISVLGAGAWGTALATSLAERVDDLILWGRSRETIDSINRSHRNPRYLGDIALADNLRASCDLAEACRADIILCVLPAQSFAALVPTIGQHVSSESKIVLCAKGIDKQSGEMLHTLAAREFGEHRIAALSGPSFARDVAQGLPTAVSLAAHSLATAQALAVELSGPRFRIYATDDLIGVEAGGALKNVMALAVGCARGLGLGASAEAALIARGFAELNRIAVALGGRAETMAGLSGLGDLVLSCSSPQSRNFAYGMAMAQGDDLANLPLAEGVHTAGVALKLAHANGVDAPIIEMVTQVLSGKVTAHNAVSLLLERPLRVEA